MQYSSDSKVYLALGFTDMRKSINTLSILVEKSLSLDPFSGHLFAFCNRRQTILKILYWDRNGFCLWQKRLERHQFKWPVEASEILEIEQRELNWLLEGLDIRQSQAHSNLSYSLIY